jgi:DNA-binding transcriptional ArsR family regulator
MARATTADAFSAVAEPHRRQILDVLAGGELPVTELVARLGLSQPLTSKHLRVLREVGLVQVRDLGRQRVYRLDAGPLRSIADWLRPFERAMSERFDLMDDVIRELKEAEHGDDDQLREGHPSD